MIDCLHKIYKIVSFFYYNLGTFELDLQGPVFSHEPPHKVEFSNNTGGHIGCSGHGSPQPEVKILSMKSNE